MRRQRAPLALLALLVLAVLVVATRGAAAPTDPKNVDTSVLAGPDEALEHDMRLVAELDPERDLEDVRQDTEVGEATAGLTEELLEQFPEVFGFVELVPGGGSPDAVVHLSGPAPAALVEVVAARPADIAITVDQVLSKEQVRRAVPAVSDALAELTRAGAYTAGYDYESNSIEFALAPVAGSDAMSLTGPANALASQVLTGLGLPAVPVVLTVDPDAGNTAEIFTGGA